MEQFLRAMERVEARTESKELQPDQLRLSNRMRDSWSTGRFWFNYGIRNSFDVDAIYWATLHDTYDSRASVESLDDETRAEMESIVKMKMEQLKAYREEFNVRFKEKENTA